MLTLIFRYTKQRGRAPLWKEKTRAGRVHSIWHMSENGFLLCWYGSSWGIQLTTHSRWPPINLSTTLTFNQQCGGGTPQMDIGELEWESGRRKAENCNIVSTQGSSALQVKCYCVTKKKSFFFSGWYAEYVHCCSVVFTAAGVSMFRHKPFSLSRPEASERDERKSLFNRSKADLPIISAFFFYKYSPVKLLVETLLGNLSHVFGCVKSIWFGTLVIDRLTNLSWSGH